MLPGSSLVAILAVVVVMVVVIVVVVVRVLLPLLLKVRRRRRRRTKRRMSHRTIYKTCLRSSYQPMIIITKTCVCGSGGGWGDQKYIKSFWFQLYVDRQIEPTTESLKCKSKTLLQHHAWCGWIWNMTHVTIWARHFNLAARARTHIHTHTHTTHTHRA